jgi:hypothetical protein
MLTGGPAGLQLIRQGSDFFSGHTLMRLGHTFMHIYRNHAVQIQICRNNTSMQLWDDLNREGELLVKYSHLLITLRNHYVFPGFAARLLPAGRVVTRLRCSLPALQITLQVSAPTCWSRPQRVHKEASIKKSRPKIHGYTEKSNSPQSSRSLNMELFVKGIPLAPYSEPVRSQILGKFRRIVILQADRRATL